MILQGFFVCGGIWDLQLLGSENSEIFCEWLTGFRGDFTVISGRGVAENFVCRVLSQGC